MIEAVFDLLIPLFMKAVIDLQKYGDPSFIPNVASRNLGTFLRGLFTFSSTNQPLNDALNGLVIILIMGIIGFLCTMVTQYIAARTALKIGTEVRTSLYKKSLQLSKSEKEKIGNSKLLTILNSDTYQVQQGILIFIRLIVRAPFIIIGALAISFLLDWRIGVIFASIVPLVLIIIFAIMAKSSKGYVAIQGELDDISNKSSDTINGIKVIKALNREEYEQNEFSEKTNSYHKKAVKVNVINSLINPLTFAIIATATILVVLIGGNSILGVSSNEGILLATTIMAEVSYLAQISFTLMQLSNVILILTKAKVSRKRCDEVLAIKPAIHNVDNPITKLIDNNDEIISFNKVTFAYEEGGNNALEDISFTLKKGESLGIIGGTGSGKSTIISLIERFMDRSSGTLLYKGSDIKEYNLTSLRQEIALVNQKSSLFKGTIKSNMLIANPNASDEDIIKALEDAEAYEFVSKYDDTINHEVTEEGKNFSGGQRQRLCIARALVKKPEIIILDDSTSALDLLTDKRVRSNIEKNYKGITKIIVSQRVSTVSNSNQILVLDGGHLLDKGTHDELLKKSQVYKETYESQIRKENE
jgi:ATP-binding cassette subfamily B protein